MIKIDKNNFKKEVVDFTGVVVIDFYADWCGPCRILSPMLEELDGTLGSQKNSQVKFAKVDVDREQELAGLFGISGIPTVVFFKNGQMVNQRVGVSQKEEYELIINQALSQTSVAKKNGTSEVIVFTTSTCPWCKAVKDYLREKKIEFKEINVETDAAWARKMVERSGQMGVPQLWIDGQTVVGFNKPQMNMLLHIK